MWSKVAKWCLYIIPLVAFAFYMNSGTLLKRPMGSNDDLEGQLHQIEQATLAGDWVQAGAAWEQAHTAFDKVERRIEVIAERDELQHFYTELHRLRGAIQAEERVTVLSQVAMLKSLFDEFGK
ncbi:MAG TPA: DUF4363 family protein [Symbiobacteriaceae bacterium]|jgi:hypothetical protein|nr:DUF4363 family protein [Symbiobacteriaceae bacterium]